MQNKLYEKWLKIENMAINKELKAMSEEQIASAFSGELSFGTAGLRGVMALGTNRMNEINVCRLANAILALCKNKKLKSVVVGFDTRHNSKKYSRIFAKVLSNGGIDANLFKEYVPTPVLTYSIKYLSADLGIMITASHNKKEYNGIKISTKDGIQISGDLEKELGKLYSKTNEVEAFNEFCKLKNANKNIHYVKNDVKKSFLGNFYKNKLNKALNIIYTPLNGTAYKYVITALKGVGFKNVVTPLKQKVADGNFTTCPYPNPEFIEAYKASLKCTENFDADVIVATDPDGDRLGAMIKSTKGYKLLTGNEMGFLLLNYLYENRAKDKNLFAVSTVVSSPMFFAMCDAYGIKFKKSLTGFKNIGKAKMQLEDKLGKDGFLMAYEESCGYIVKDGFYDKDGIFALLRFCELASYLKNKGSSVEEYLEEIYQKFDNVYSLNSSLEFKGENALDRMNKAVDDLRQKGLKTLNKKKIVETVDYLIDKTGLDKSNFIEYKTQDFSFIIRPSGTEPKLKFYIHAKGENLDASKKLANDVLLAIKKEIFEINE
ncbi:MAG: phospho-sugar mutase [Clostridiales bacterium]|nr:phospho-sugar mutase [Clostridiales bacterium]